MWKLSALIMCLAGLMPGLAGAVEVKIGRATYGTPAGVTRSDAKYLPSDVLFLEYEIRGLIVSDKTGAVAYSSVLEFIDKSGKAVSSTNNPKQEVILSLGGNTVPAVLVGTMGDEHKPGKYKVRLTVKDHNAKDAKPAVLEYPFELLPKAFGVVRVEAPAIGIVGGNYFLNFAVSEMELDKNSDPNIDMKFRVLEAGSKKEVAKFSMSYPRDMPDGVNLKKVKLAPVGYQLNLNRPGRFIVDVEVADKLSKQAPIKMQFPLNVLEIKQAVMTSLDERIAQFRKMAQDDPDNELGHFRLGQLLTEAEQHEEAVKSFRRTLELSPQFSKVYQLLGAVLMKLGRTEEAIQVLRQGFDVADERGDNVPRGEMARLLVELGQPAPQPRQSAGADAGGGGFRCQRPGCVAGALARQLPRPPMPDDLGRQIHEKVCVDCWDSWFRNLSIKVINEMRLDLSTEKGQETYDHIMKETLGLQ